jgi:hypothetical protein
MGSHSPNSRENVTSEFLDRAREWCKAGDPKGCRTGRYRAFDKEAVLSFLRRSEVGVLVAQYGSLDDLFRDAPCRIIRDATRLLAADVPNRMAGSSAPINSRECWDRINMGDAGPDHVPDEWLKFLADEVRASIPYLESRCPHSFLMLQQARHDLARLEDLVRGRAELRRRAS